MEYTLTAGKQSNYEVTMTFSSEEMDSYKQKALEGFQKDMKEPGFREGKVPLDIVEKKVSPEYIIMGQLEEAIHVGTQKLLEEEKEIKFIGTIYDLNREEKDNNTIITFKLDIYPEVTEKDDKWKSIKLDAIDKTATPEEVEETINNLKKQYAEYNAAEVISDGSLAKVKFTHLDADGGEVDNGTVFIGQEEYDEFPILKDIFIGKKAGEKFQIEYDQEKLPPMLHNRKEETTSVNIDCEIQDVRDITLPELTEENIQKFFGNAEVKTIEELTAKITEAIEAQKNEMSLMQAIDKLLQEAQSSFELIIPQTLINEEMKSRNKSLADRMGGEEGLQKYFEKIGTEEKEKMMGEINAAAKLSLEKFFLLRHISESLEITEPNWEKPLDVETKVYEKMTAK